MVEFTYKQPDLTKLEDVVMIIIVLVWVSFVHAVLLVLVVCECFCCGISQSSEIDSQENFIVS